MNQSISSVDRSGAEWQKIAARKQANREAILAQYPTWRLDSPPAADVLDVSQLIFSKLNESERNIVHLDATDIISSIKHKKYTAVEVLTAFCKVAVVAQDTINCLTDIFFDEAFERARELDEHLEKTGEVVGPLHGLPVSVKDRFNVKGVDKTFGYVAWAYKNIAKEDASSIVALRKAGAIPFVKTSNPQGMVCIETNTPLYGRTVNVFNRNLSCGGSSGGEGALVSAHGSPMGIAGDMGGSVRIPSSWSGVYGLRPTVARFPSASYSGMDNLLVTVGPLAQSVRDLELFCQAFLAEQPWTYDPSVVNIPWKVDVTLPQKLSIAILWDDGVIKPHPPITSALKQVKQTLEAQGHEVIDWEPMDHKQAVDLYMKYFVQDGGQSYIDTMAKSGEPQTEGTKWFLTHADRAYTVPEVWEMNVRRDEFRVRGLAHWAATSLRTSSGRPIDAILCPAQCSLAVPHDQSRYWGYTCYWSLLDWPAAVFPLGSRFQPGGENAGYTNWQPRNDVDKHYKEIWGEDGSVFTGAPVALQLVGTRHEEEKLLAILGIIDQAVKASHD